MGINLRKGETINLNKNAGSNGLRTLQAAIGWDENKFNVGGKFDLDISIFALESDATLESNYRLTTEDDFCFYGHKVAVAGALKHGGDNRSGAGAGDDEVINMDLTMIRPEITNLSIVVSISDPNVNGITFGKVPNSYVRIVNSLSGEEICKYELEKTFTTETAVQVGSLVRKNGEWEFVAMGYGYDAGLGEFLTQYGYTDYTE